MLVVWSGGCDSTLVLWNLLHDKENNTNIRTISITHPALGASKEQAKARKLILKKLRDQGHRIQHIEIEVNATGAQIMGSQNLPQATLWLGVVIPYLIDDEDLYVGYIRTDDIWHEIQEYRWAFQYLAHVCGRGGSLQIPLMLSHKCDVIKQLRKARLLSLTFYCETPIKGKPCKKCCSCLTHACGLHRLKLTSKQDAIDAKRHKELHKHDKSITSTKMARR